jgi:hypothetical protein
MKKIYCFFLLLFSFYALSTSQVKAQSLNDRFFIGWGYSYFDYMSGKLASQYKYLTSAEPRIIFGLGASLNMGFNLVEFNENNSLSLNSPITGIFGIGGTGFSIPLTVNYNRGNISTYRTDKVKGLTIGAGAEYNYIGFPYLNVDTEYEKGTRAWVQPVVNIGYRYWDYRNRAREVNLKVGYGTSSYTAVESYDSDILTTVNTPTVSFRLSFVRYFNY